MADKNIDKKAILLQVIEALKEDNNEVIVETVDGNEIPTNERKDYDAKEKNASKARTIKVGKDITIERVYGVSKFAVKINGERVEFAADDKMDDSYDIEDVRGIWSAARNKYIDEKGDYFYRLRNHAGTKELKDAVMEEKQSGNKKDKYEKAIENLKKLGISPDRLQEFLANKQLQND